MSQRKELAILGWCLLGISGCSGQYDGTAAGGGGNGSRDSGSTVRAQRAEEYFANNIQPNLDFCRSRHVPGGVANVADGRKFSLFAEGSEDLWAAMAPARAATGPTRHAT